MADDDGAQYFMARVGVEGGAGGSETLPGLMADEPPHGELDAQQRFVNCLHEEFEPMVCELGGPRKYIMSVLDDSGKQGRFAEWCWTAMGRGIDAW